METLILRNARRISDLENKNRVAISNVSMESKKISNEGSTLKASSGVITSNVPLKAPNIPDDLKEKVELIDTMETRLAQCESDVANKADVEHTHKVSDLTDYINDISQRLLLYTQVKNYGISVYGDAIIKASGSLKYNGTNVSLEGHTHAISEIEQLNDTLDNKADKDHNHDTVYVPLKSRKQVGTSYYVKYFNQDDRIEVEADKVVSGTTNIYVNSMLGDGIWMREVRSGENIKYDKNGITFDNGEVITKNFRMELLQTIYPVGSIYTSMSSTSPATLFGFGTWTQIVDRFLYCSSSSNTTGGSKKISASQLPAHTHNGQFRVVGYPVRNGYPPKSIYRDTEDTTGLYINWDGSAEGIQINVPANTGGGEDYLPPYMTVYCWYRTA